MSDKLKDTLRRRFRDHFGDEPKITAFAPGRVEVLGNHTDYNEGFALSAATNLGTFFSLAPSDNDTCRLVAADLMEEATFSATSPARSSRHSWANYVIGVFAKLREHGKTKQGFNGMFLTDLPIGGGLSSSAALEISAALAICALYGINLSRLELAKISQMAEHEFGGTHCGLLDQLSSLFGRPDKFIMIDFRSLDMRHVPFGHDMCLLVCNTGITHSLADSEYNERRAKCHEAAMFFDSVLDHPIAALRDVTMEEWGSHAEQMDHAASKRSAHVIGENNRVVVAERLLAEGNLKEFGKLMLKSHESSQRCFENSSPELDFVVDTARALPDVLGARLSGGGFGGCVVVLLPCSHTNAAGQALADAYRKKFKRDCTLTTIHPSGPARLIQGP